MHAVTHSMPYYIMVHKTEYCVIMPYYIYMVHNSWLFMIIKRQMTMYEVNAW